MMAITSGLPSARIEKLFDDLTGRVEELEIAVRAALSFIQDRHYRYGAYDDRHAQAVVMALRGALANRERD